MKNHEELGFEYYQQKNYQKAFEHLLQGSLEGSGRCMNKIGIMYYLGNYVEKDLQKALEWYKRAYDAGFIKACENIGQYYDFVEKDAKQSFEWYEEGAMRKDSGCQFKAGLAYENGHGTPQDVYKAYFWYSKSAEQNNSRGLYYLGMLHKNGKGIPKNTEKAYECFMKGAELNERQCAEELILGCTKNLFHPEEKELIQIIEYGKKALDKIPYLKSHVEQLEKTIQSEPVKSEPVKKPVPVKSEPVKSEPVKQQVQSIEPKKAVHFAVIGKDGAGKSTFVSGVMKTLSHSKALTPDIIKGEKESKGMIKLSVFVKDVAYYFYVAKEDIGSVNQMLKAMPKVDGVFLVYSAQDCDGGYTGEDVKDQIYLVKEKNPDVFVTFLNQCDVFYSDELEDIIDLVTNDFNDLMNEVTDAEKKFYYGSAKYAFETDREEETFKKMIVSVQDALSITTDKTAEKANAEKKIKEDAIRANQLRTGTAFTTDKTEKEVKTEKKIKENAIRADQLRTGTTFEWDGCLMQVRSYSCDEKAVHLNLINMSENRKMTLDLLKTDEVQKAVSEKIEVELLYAQEDYIEVMDSRNYEIYTVKSHLLTAGMKYVQEGTECTAVMFKGEVISVEAPRFVEAKVIRTSSVGFNTSRVSTKTAYVESGAQIQVPLFISEGEIILIDTLTCEYINRA